MLSKSRYDWNVVRYSIIKRESHWHQSICAYIAYYVTRRTHTRTHTQQRSKKTAKNLCVYTHTHQPKKKTMKPSKAMRVVGSGKNVKWMAYDFHFIFFFVVYCVCVMNHQANTENPYYFYFAFAKFIRDILIYTNFFPSSGCLALDIVVACFFMCNWCWTLLSVYSTVQMSHT